MQSLTSFIVTPELNMSELGMECSGSDSPKGYTCDTCTKRDREREI